MYVRTYVIVLLLLYNFLIIPVIRMLDNGYSFMAANLFH